MNLVQINLFMKENVKKAESSMFSGLMERN